MNKKGFTITGNYFVDAVLLLVFIAVGYLIVSAVFKVILNVKLPWF